jgi:hypothetical protein
MTTYHIIGCGGIGAWLAQGLYRLLPADGTNIIVLHDGDTLELRNLDRQNFPESAVGQNKAKALMRVLDRGGRSLIVDIVPRYLTPATTDITEGDIVFLCVDNHAARRTALFLADNLRSTAVINAANEYTDSEAWIYLPWLHLDTAADPRVRWPDLMTDHSGDPTTPCTGEAQEAAPQLALANMGAAYMALHLWYQHMVVVPAKEIKMNQIADLPYHHSANWSRLRSTTTNDCEVAQ